MPNLGPTEILIILGIVVLLFGGRKLPELARGSGRALRIFKSEVKGLEKDDEKPEALETTEAEKKPEQG
jgi:sec-independent protein translocase protein TatA